MLAASCVCVEGWKEAYSVNVLCVFELNIPVPSVLTSCLLLLLPVFTPNSYFIVFSLLTRAAGQMDFSQVSCPLMTPPISPAALAHRGSVINQGPVTGRPLTSSSSSSSVSSSSITSSSPACLSSLSAVTQPTPCSSYSETLYHCLPQTSSGYFSPTSGSVSNYQSALRSASF